MGVGAAPDLVFEGAAELIAALARGPDLATEVTGWSYRHSRDLTGFQDGIENPPIAAAADVAVVLRGLWRCRLQRASINAPLDVGADGRS